MEITKKRELLQFAAEIRTLTLRGLGELGFGHIGGAFSIADLLAVLYGKRMRVRPEEPNWPDRDWLVCSKGHAGPAIYATLALKGYFPKEWMMTINQPGTHLPSHCDRRLTPGIDMTTGSLGQGASTAVGVAYGNRLSGRDSRTYLVLGDGEIQEGQVWEAMSFVAHHRLTNLTTFIDYNKKQLDGYISDINDFSNIAERMQSFGLQSWLVNGHDVEAIDDAIEAAMQSEVPCCIVLDTVKAKGYPFAEELLANHHIPISRAQMAEGIQAIAEDLKKAVNAL